MKRIVDCALAAPTRQLARDVSTRMAQALGQPVRIGNRSFLLYGKPVTNGRAIVVASDAAIFLGAVAWTPLPAAQLFVTDPAGVVWAGCETSGGCRAENPDARAGARPAVRFAARGTSVAISSDTPTVQVAERVDRATGSWVVTWRASMQPILAQQRSMVTRVVLTALAAAIAVGAVGAVILRQQRTAVELAGRLRYAQALADARRTSQSIVENAPLGVLGLSGDGLVMLANGFFMERLGPIRLGVPLAQAFPPATTDAQRELQELLVRGLAGRDGGPPELRQLVTPSHQFHVRIVPVGDRELGVRTFALVEDQSQLRDLEQHLIRAEKLITVGVLSAGIAHEIGSPLVVIRGRAEQVLRTVEGTPRAEDLRTIIRHIDQIASTIRQVLDFSRRQRIERRAVSLATAFDRAPTLSPAVVGATK